MTSRPLTATASNLPGANGNSRGLAEALAGIREVTRKMAACEAAMEGRGAYLGIKDPVVLLDQLRTLQRKEEQLREVHLIFLRSAIFTQTASPSTPASLLALPPASSVARQQAVLNPSQAAPGDGHSQASSLTPPVVGPTPTTAPLATSPGPAAATAAAAAAPSTAHPAIPSTPVASPSPVLPAPVISSPPAPAPAPVASPVATPAAVPAANSASVSGSVTATSTSVTSSIRALSSTIPTAPPVSTSTGKSFSLHEALGLAVPAPAPTPARTEQHPPWLGRHALYRTTSPTNPPSSKKSTPVAMAAGGGAGRATRSTGALPNGKASSGAEPRANGLPPAAKEQAIRRRELRSDDAGATQSVAVFQPDRNPAPMAAPTPASAPTGTPVSTPTSDRAAQMLPFAKVKQESVEAPATSSSGNAKSCASEELVYMRSLFEGEPPAHLQVDANDAYDGRGPETNSSSESALGDPASRNSDGDTPDVEGSWLEATPLPADPLEPSLDGAEVAGAPDPEGHDSSAPKRTGEQDSLGTTPIDAKSPQASGGAQVGGTEAAAPTTPTPQRAADPATSLSATASAIADGQMKVSPKASPKAGSSRKKRKSARSGWRSRYSAEEFELGDTIESSPESSGSAMAGGRDQTQEAKREGSSGGQEKKRGEEGSTADDGDEDWTEQVDVGGAEDDDEENAVGEDESQRKRKPKTAVRKRDPPNAWKKRCADGNCQLGASFGMEGQPAVYCSAHKDVGMVNVTHRRCGEPGCGHQPSFNIEGEKRAMYCYAHKKPGMINVSSPRCATEGCMVRPSFGFIGDRRASFCDAHKLEGMLNIRKRRRVVVAKPLEGADAGLAAAGTGASGLDGGHSFEQSFLSTASVTGSAAGTPGADSLPPLVSGFGDPASPLEKDGGVRVDSDTGLFQADSGSSFLAAVSIAAGGDVGVLPEQEQGM